MRTVVLLIVASCTPSSETSSDLTSDSGSTPLPTAETGTEPTTPPTASLAVATNTTGDVVDANGYQFQIDDDPPVSIAQSETVWQDVEPGPHEITLLDVDAPCEIQGDVTRSVVVQPDDADIVTFEVECVPRLGDDVLFTTIAGGQSAAMRVRLDGSGIQELDPGLGDDVAVLFPTSVDGKTITYLRREATEPDQLWTMDAAGRQGGLVLSFPDGITSFALTLDGTRVVFAGGTTPRDVYVYDIATGALDNITNTSATDEANPAWSPDGTRVVYARQQVGAEYRVWTMDDDGGNAEALTGLTGHEAMPAWSPDGTRIAYASTRARPIDQLPTGDLEIHVVDANGENDQFISSNIIDDMLPSWSADSQELVYTVVPVAGESLLRRTALKPGSVDVTVYEKASVFSLTSAGSWGR